MSDKADALPGNPKSVWDGLKRMGKAVMKKAMNISKKKKKSKKTKPGAMDHNSTQGVRNRNMQIKKQVGS